MKTKRLSKTATFTSPWTRCLQDAKAKHFDDGKPGIQYLLAMGGLAEVAKVGDYGAAKYGDRWNYRKGMAWMKLAGSCTRHLWKFIHGEDVDPESSCLHLAHLVFDALMLLEYVTEKRGTDDR